jgi:hypothetical protein
MPELERQLRALGGAIAYPPVPDLVAAVRPRLERRPARSWRPLAVGLAVLVLALGIAFAVPPARSALLRFFHLRGATVERVEVLPAAPEQTARDLGQLLPTTTAKRRLGFRLLLPPDAQPARVYVLQHAVATIPLRWHGRRLLLFEFRGATEMLLKKVVPFQSNVEPTQVGSDPALWVSGGRHVLTWVDSLGSFREKPVSITGNALLWLHDGLVLRLQGRISRHDALALALSIR